MATHSFLGMIQFVVIILGLYGIAEAFQCYACTYVFAGHDGRMFYECVNDTSQFLQTRKLECQLPKKCVIKTVYDQSCEIPEKETSCDSPDAVRPTCFRNCAMELCNGRNADMKPVVDVGGGTSMPFNKLSVALTLSLALMCNYAIR